MKPLLLFGIKFLAASLLFFLIWQPFTHLYPYFLMPVANLLIALTGHPVTLQVIQGEIALTYPLQNETFSIYLGNQDVIYLNLIVLIGLFVASGITHHHRYVRLNAAFGVLYLSHVVHFYMLSYVGIWRYFRQMAATPDQLPDHLLKAAEAAGQFLPIYTNLVRLNLLLDFWRNWGMMALAFLIWLLFSGLFMQPQQTQPETPHAT